MKPFLSKSGEKEEVLGEGKCTWNVMELQCAFDDIT
jgi:hypothetical protein